MAAPTLARSDLDGDRFYPWKGEAYYSTTTIINGGVPKYAIAPWYGKVVAELVTTEILARGPHARAHALVRRWTAQGRAEFLERQARGELKSLKLDKQSPLDLALRYLKGQPVRLRDTAAEVGISVHSEAEDLVLRLALDDSGRIATGASIETVAWPENLAGYEASFLAFLRDFEPAYELVEATVFNPPQAYAGTLDAIAHIRCGLLQAGLERAGTPIPEWLDVPNPNHYLPILLDIKSGKSLHPEVGMQLASYARGAFIGLADGVTEVPVPAVAGALALHLTPDGYRLRPVRIDDEVYEAFLNARAVFRFKKQIAGTVLGPDLAPAKAEVAA